MDNGMAIVVLVVGSVGMIIGSIATIIIQEVLKWIL